jgi:ribulose-phosphate 3-epimerase
MPTPDLLVKRVRTMAPTISVGVLTADLMSLGAEIERVNGAGVQILHFDVMDGQFCPMLTMGPPVIKGVKTALLKDVHLMIRDPLEKLESFVAAGADIITFQVEACLHPHRALQAMRQMTNANDPARGVLRGVALNPGTPMEALDPLMDELDVVLLLAVNPGWGGQKFIASTAGRVERLHQMIQRSGRNILISVDGGITRENVSDVARMGANIIVTGSAVFDGKAPAENARHMLAAIAQARRV